MEGLQGSRFVTIYPPFLLGWRFIANNNSAGRDGISILVSANLNYLQIKSKLSTILVIFRGLKGDDTTSVGFLDKNQSIDCAKQ